ncbi:MAG: cytochrome c, partial [candidate division Zixibacteria bacterium]|nr:cytochrome c [candidate division Zixibacteria bacterium]
NFGRHYISLLFIFTLVVAAMGTGRHLYRETSLESHNALIASESERFQSILQATRMRLEAGLGAGEALSAQLTGEKVFVNCAACHAVNKVLAAPSLVEVYSLYKDNPEGIVAWAKAPGKKRPQFAPMPSFAHLGDEKLRLVADYIIEKGAENTPPSDNSFQ